MNIKRLASFALALPLSLFVVSIINSSSVSAAVDTCTWTGGGSDDNMTNAANWTGCDNGAVPEVAGPVDSLLFPVTATDKNVVNDFPVNSDFNIITFENFGYTLSGNAFTPNAINMTGTGGPVDAVTTISANIVAFNLSLNNTSEYDLSMTGNIAVGGGSNLSISAANDPILLTGVISGAGTVSKTGTGTAILAGSNTYTGITTISNGIIVGLTANALGSNSAGTVVASGAALEYGPEMSSANFEVSEPLTLNGPGLGLITTLSYFTPNTESTGTFTHSGNITVGTADVEISSNLPLTISGVMSGSGGIKYTDLSSDNNAALKTTATNTLTGTTTVSGVMVVEGNQSSSPVVVVSGGTLKGAGTLGLVTIQSGGKVAPGNSPGCLNTGNITVAGTYDFELAGTAACTEYDQIKVTGTVDLTGSSLNVAMLNSFRPANENTFMIIENDAADTINGTFADKAEGATFTVDGVVYKISYVGGTGNDVTLTVVGGTNVAGAPTTPNTGVKMLLASPFLTLSTTLVSGAALMAIARKYSLFVK